MQQIIFHTQATLHTTHKSMLGFSHNYLNKNVRNCLDFKKLNLKLFAVFVIEKELDSMGKKLS